MPHNMSSPGEGTHSFRSRMLASSKLNGSAPFARASTLAAKNNPMGMTSDSTGARWKTQLEAMHRDCQQWENIRRAAEEELPQLQERIKHLRVQQTELMKELREKQTRVAFRNKELSSAVDQLQRWTKRLSNDKKACMDCASHFARLQMHESQRHTDWTLSLQKVHNQLELAQDQQWRVEGGVQQVLLSSRAIHEVCPGSNTSAHQTLAKLEESLAHERQKNEKNFHKIRKLRVACRAYNRGSSLVTTAEAESLNAAEQHQESKWRESANRGTPLAVDQPGRKDQKSDSHMEAFYGKGSLGEHGPGKQTGAIHQGSATV